MEIVVVLWNVAVFLLYGFDKRQSIKKKRRISEKMLLVCAALFGGAGAFAGMQLFRHKTRKWRFKILVPVLLIGQILIICYFYK